MEFMEFLLAFYCALMKLVLVFSDFAQHVYSLVIPAMSTKLVNCNWNSLRTHLMQEWNGLTPSEIDSAGPDAVRLAQLIERKYGINRERGVNYIYNLARTLPFLNNA